MSGFAIAGIAVLVFVAVVVIDARAARAHRRARADWWGNFPEDHS